jgi:hypothetical protein
MEARPGHARTLAGWFGAAPLLVALLVVGASAQGLCPPQLLTFRSLQHGEFDYCRMHLRYRPGTYDCLRIVAPTCNFVVDGQRRPGLTLGSGGELFGTAERIVCPPGPPAPSCPAGYPDAPIPRP